MRLAAIRFEAHERALLEADLDKIVSMIDAMLTVDADGVEPLSNPLDGTQPLRPDRVTEIVDRDRLQVGAPLTGDGHYLVPRVVDDADATFRQPIDASARPGGEARDS